MNVSAKLAILNKCALATFCNVATVGPLVVHEYIDFSPILALIATPVNDKPRFFETSLILSISVSLMSNKRSITYSNKLLKSVLDSIVFNHVS